MKIYEQGQKAIYEEDGARAVVEVLERGYQDAMEVYKLRVTIPLNTSVPLFADERGKRKSAPDISFPRGFKQGQELTVSRNYKSPSDGTWGIWTLTDIVDTSER